jgi:nitrile hydratase beta subunit
MNGVHDLGGLHGFGPVEPEPDEPVFHAPWEGRVLALNRALGFTGAWTLDTARAAIEELPAHVYLDSTYYERWALRLERLLLRYGLVDADELAAGRALRAGPPLPRTLTAGGVGAVLARGSVERAPPAAARFAPGERVRAKNIHPPTHTRLPRYARGRRGLIEAVRGCHVFPDAVATGAGEQPQWLYTVVFTGRELWGEDADPASTVSIDAFEPYLEPV